ncbi:hypothetical protein [Streptomyces sp. Root369]|uniref:hypothetical protein n=1 Tax=Streptomyces sp. Root369 TaxID=1736523 RepID=UPI00070E7990|nr:hypothetical protein [Streptomyces sp. Root369]KQW13543.1 hypothetical protein ASD08_30735 [Streptomyces sp. Root369]
MASIDETAIAAIFTAAATATSWKRTNLGLSTEVAHGGLTWGVQLPQDSGRAYISGSSGHGGDTCEYIEATWPQTLPIVEAAMTATRVH